MRLKVRDSKKVATCVGFGPRFLHSTGQAYKGGPDTGVFVEITGEPVQDLDIPGRTHQLRHGRTRAGHRRFRRARTSADGGRCASISQTSKTGLAR